MTTVAPRHPTASKRAQRIHRSLLLGALTVSVSSTLGTPLIPTIAQDQGVSLETAQWMLTVTLLVGAVMTPLLGRLGDGARRKQLLEITLLTSVAGAVVAATAESFPQLLLGRGLQGVGYATVPLSIALARDALDGDQQRRTIAALSITVAVGAGLGFPVTGLIAQRWDYHAAFWCAAAFGAVALAAAHRVLPSGRRVGPAVRLDVLGAVLLALGLGALLLALSRASSWGWLQPSIVALAAAGSMILAAWVSVELRRDHPLVDLRLSTSPAVLGANLTAVLVGAGMYLGLALVNRLVQTPTSAGYGFGASLVLSGLVLMPLSVGSLVSQPLARAISGRFGLRAVLPVGCAVGGTALAVAALAHDHLGQLAVVAALLGVGVGTTFAAMPALIVAAVPQERTASAMSLNQVLRSVGGAAGSAAGASILAAHTAADARFPDASSYTTAFTLGALLCAMALVAALAALPRSLGRGPAEVEVDLLMEESAAGAGLGPSAFNGEEGR